MNQIISYPMLLICEECVPEPSNGLNGAIVSGEKGCVWCVIGVVAEPSIAGKDRFWGLPSFDDGENFLKVRYFREN